MRGRSSRHHSQASGPFFTVVAALLIAPILFVLALFYLAGPSTRAALAGDDLAELDQRATLLAPSAGELRADGTVHPLSDASTDPAADVADVAPIFEPRIGRFRLDSPDPGADDHPDREGHARPPLPSPA